MSALNKRWRNRTSKPRSESQEPSERKGIDYRYIFDIETEEWDRFVVGGLYDAVSDTFQVYWHDREEDYARRILSLKGNLFAHNGGRYDTLWLCKWIRKLGLDAEVYATSARITLLKVGALEVRDLAALVPMKLEDAAGIGTVPKSGTGLECDLQCSYALRRKKSCGGYCRIRREGMTDLEKNRLQGYLEIDCRCAASILEHLNAYAMAFDLDLRGTIGSSSWATAERRYNLPTAEWPDDGEYKLAREGYYGGRVQVFKPVSRTGFRKDVNSAYPAALAAVELPTGPKRRIRGEKAKRAFQNHAPGVYRAKVYVPKQHIPPLPYRDEKGRVHYPTGTIIGAWTEIELRYAVEHCGVEVKDFGECLVWETAAPILSSFARWGWDLRHTAGKDSAIGKWLKWFLNSLTGKLAQSPETEVCFMTATPPPACKGGEHCAGVLCGLSSVGCCNHRCVGACGRANQLGKDSGVYVKEVWRIPRNGHIHWAAYLTAWARIQLHKQLVNDGMGGLTAVYCDTDCVVSEVERTWNCGEDLGQWLDEGDYQPWKDLEGVEHPGFEALAPKTYTMHGWSKKKQKYEKIVKSKGIGEPDWGGMKAKQPQLVDTGVIQFRSGARKGSFFERKNLSRTLRYDGIRYGDRTIGGDWTHPPHFN